MVVAVGKGEMAIYLKGTYYTNRWRNWMGLSKIDATSPEAGLYVLRHSLWVCMCARSRLSQGSVHELPCTTGLRASVSYAMEGG